MVMTAKAENNSISEIIPITSNIHRHPTPLCPYHINTMNGNAIKKYPIS